MYSISSDTRAVSSGPCYIPIGFRNNQLSVCIMIWPPNPEMLLNTHVIDKQRFGGTLRLLPGILAHPKWYRWVDALHTLYTSQIRKSEIHIFNSFAVATRENRSVILSCQYISLSTISVRSTTFSVLGLTPSLDKGVYPDDLVTYNKDLGVPNAIHRTD